MTELNQTLVLVAEAAAIKALEYFKENAQIESIPQEYLKIEQAAKYLGLGVSTLNTWRCYNEGPKHIKLSQAVRYKKSDLDEFMNQHKQPAKSEVNYAE